MFTVSTSVRVATTRVDVEAGDALDVLLGEGREGVVDGDGDRVVGLGDRDQAVLAGERARDALGDHVEVEVEGVDLHVGQAGVGGDRLRDLDLVGDPELDDRLLGGARC